MGKIYIILAGIIAFLTALFFLILYAPHTMNNGTMTMQESIDIAREKKVAEPLQKITNIVPEIEQNIDSTDDKEKTQIVVQQFQNNKELELDEEKKQEILQSVTKQLKEVQETIESEDTTTIDLGDVSNNSIRTGEFFDDESIQKFVSPDISFYKPSYIPNDLEKLESEYIIDQKGTAQLRSDAAKLFYEMAEVFYEEFGEKMKVVSTYRSYEYQKGIKDRGCPDTLCSKAGHSEHQSGLAIDLWETSTYEIFTSTSDLNTYFEWMRNNAHLYGFHNSYQKGLEVDGYEREPWHWRYVGENIATRLHESNLTFTELYYLRYPDADR